MIDLFRTCNYSRDHPSQIFFWNGNRNSLEDDPSTPVGWKIKLIQRSSKPNPYGEKHYIPPNDHIMIRSKLGVLVYSKWKNNEDMSSENEGEMDKEELDTNALNEMKPKLKSEKEIKIQLNEILRNSRFVKFSSQILDGKNGVKILRKEAG